MKGKPSKSDSTKKYLFIGMLAVAIFVLARAFLKRREAAVSPSASWSEVKPQENQGAAFEPDTGLKPLESKAVGKRLASSVLPIPEREPGVLSLLIKPVARTCLTGDYELIRNAVKSLDEKSLLVELRSINPEGSVAFPVAIQDFLGKKPLKLPYGKILNAQGKPQAFMLSICQDQKREGRCDKKRIFGTKAARTLDAKEFKDRTYYAQILVRDALGFQLFPTAKWDKASFQKILELFDDGIGLSKDEVEKARLLIAKLGPIPATLSGSSLEINLSATDPRCSH